jgi:signal transduction histidine kinase
MRFPLLRTLSARIVLGFAIVIVTFAAVSIVTVLNMQQFTRNIGVIRNGYLPLALKANDLSGKQLSLLSYLRNELAEEQSPNLAHRRMLGLTASRDTLLRETEAVLEDVRALPVSHKRMEWTSQHIAQIRAEVDAQKQLYKVLLEAPPIARIVDSPRDVSPGVDRAKYDAAGEALIELQQHEARIYNLVHTLETQQRNFVEDTARRLEDNGSKLKLFTIYLGITAGLIALLMAVWATVTLRPLKRLRVAATKIATGEYGNRIEEKGPAEVAELAHEFNVMGRAIEEREREVVRSARLVAVGKMAAMITHEVRNPLSSIGLNTELLEEELGDLPEEQVAEARALCRAITTEVDRLTGITEEYLHFARLPKPKLHVEHLNNIAKSLADFEREQLALRGIELSTDFADELPPVHADEAQIRQALLNLLRNAADAVEEIGGGAVSMSSRVSDDGENVELLVTDDGPGIASDLAPKLFEPFFSTKHGGTGLGLALTHQIVREHGGDILIDSEPGHGATFRVVLPISDRGA